MRGKAIEASTPLPSAYWQESPSRGGVQQSISPGTNLFLDGRSTDHIESTRMAATVGGRKEKTDKKE
jgi:hypothetical protein